MQYLEKSLLRLVRRNIPDGIHKYTSTRNRLTTAFQMINISEKDNTVERLKAKDDNVLDSEMIILKSDGIIVIDKDTVLTPNVRKKAMIVVADILINNGRITMEARGSSAQGENVYLFENQFVPAIGAKGGDRTYLPYNLGMYQTQQKNGNSGANGINRQSGGGGAGSANGGYCSTSANYSGAGGYGTSYSGGAGSGAMGTQIQMREPWRLVNTQDVINVYGSDAANTTDGNWWNSAMGGIGVINGKDVVNKSGYQAYNYGDQYYWNKGVGTGGLLIIFANLLINLGQIDSNGSSIVPYSWLGDEIIEGGCSGGGSVNLITGNYLSDGGIVCANGGKGIGLYHSLLGGSGGNGCVTIDEGILSPVRLNTNIFKDMIPQEVFEHSKIFN